MSTNYTSAATVDSAALAAAATSALAAPITPAEMAALNSQLDAAAAAAEASHLPADVSTDASARKLDEDMASFDAVFARVGGLKAEAMAAREAVANGNASGATMSDADRRKKAEETVMRLLQSMGMEDELDGESEREDE